MKRKDEGLTPQQAQVIALLLAGKSQVEAANAVGVAPESISRWKANNAAFVAAYNEAQQAHWDAITTKLDNLATHAIDALAGLMEDDDPKVRLQAVRLWLEHRPARPIGKTNPAAVKAEMRLDEVISTFGIP